MPCAGSQLPAGTFTTLSFNHNDDYIVGLMIPIIVYQHYILRKMDEFIRRKALHEITSEPLLVVRANLHDTSHYHVTEHEAGSQVITGVNVPFSITWPKIENVIWGGNPFSKHNLGCGFIKKQGHIYHGDVYSPFFQITLVIWKLGAHHWSGFMLRYWKCVNGNAQQVLLNQSLRLRQNNRATEGNLAERSLRTRS